MGSLPMGPASLKRQCHLVTRRRSRRESIAACRFGRELAMQLSIEVDKSQTLSLPGREGVCRIEVPAKALDARPLHVPPGGKDIL